MGSYRLAGCITERRVPRWCGPERAAAPRARVVVGIGSSRSPSHPDDLVEEAGQKTARRGRRRRCECRRRSGVDGGLGLGIGIHFFVQASLTASRSASAESRVLTVLGLRSLVV